MQITTCKKFFPTQEDDEKVFYIIKRHWFTYLIFGLVAILTGIPILAILLYLYFTSTHLSMLVGNLLILFVSIYLLILLGVFIYGFIDYYLDSYIITDQRIIDIKQNGFFKRQISELNLLSIEDVKAKVEGAGATFFNFGSVIIQTAAETDNFEFQTVGNPYLVAKRILDLHEACLSKEEGKRRN